MVMNSQIIIQKLNQNIELISCPLLIIKNIKYQNINFIREKISSNFLKTYFYIDNI